MLPWCTPTGYLHTGRACVSSPWQLAAIIACRGFKACVSLLMSKNATGLGGRKLCSFPSCNQHFSMQHVQGPWQRGWSHFCKATSTWRLPVLGECRGARLWEPPACRQVSPTLDQHQFSHSDPQLHAVLSGTDSGNNSLFGAHIKQDKINAGNSPVQIWGVDSGGQRSLHKSCSGQKGETEHGPCSPPAQK